METSLLYLMGIAILLVGGILITILSNKIRISNTLTLILLGVLLGFLTKDRYDIFSFGTDFLIALAILTLAMVVFDGASRFKLGDVDALSALGLRMVFSFMGVAILILVPVTLILFPPPSLLEGIVYAIIFAVTMVGTDPAAVFVLLKDKTSRIMELLKIEAIMNTPIIVLIPLLLIDILQQVTSPTGEGQIVSIFIEYLQPFLMQIVVAVGLGLVIGLVVIRAMRKFYSENLSPIALMGAALLAYALSEVMGGSGVLAVAILGVAFGNTYVREKRSLQEFSSLLSTSLEILVFVLVGVAMYPLPADPLFWIAAMLLYALLTLARYLALKWVTRKEGFTKREHMFLALNMPKGIAVAVVIFSFMNSDPAPYLWVMLNLMVIFMILSLLIASITDRGASAFLEGAKKEESSSQDS